MKIELIPKTGNVTLQAILPYAAMLEGNPQTILVTDFYIQGAENWTAKSWGFETNVNGIRVCNIDHHAPVPGMEREISSGNLAMQFLDQESRMDGIVLINHTDCDSIVSAGLLARKIRPGIQWGKAVLAADHTGEVNYIADVLQAIEPLRNCDVSLAAVVSLESLAALGPVVDGHYQSYIRERSKHVVIAERARMIGKVACITESVQALVGIPRLMPKAEIIVSAYEQTDPSPGWRMRVRLGSGRTHNLRKIMSFDPNCRGRWNAMSNARAGGTTLDPEAYCRLIDLALHA